MARTQENTKSSKASNNIKNSEAAAKSKSIKLKKRPSRVGGSFAFYGLLAAVIVLLGISLLMVVSAQSGEYVIMQVEKQAEELTSQGEVAGLSDIQASLVSVTIRHLASMALGIILCLVISRINYHVFIRLAIPFAVVTLILLLLVALFGEEIKGAQRWIFIAGQSLQPSEFAKPALIVLASYIFYKIRVEGKDDLANYQLWIVPASLAVAILVLVFQQPDLGTLLIMLIGVASVYLIMELPLRRLLTAMGGGGALLFALMMMIPNRRARLLSYITSFGAEAEVPHQTLQARIALGTGGIFGLGPGLSKQKYRYLPEAQNDFILAIIGEELGLLGIIAVLGAFMIIAWAGFKIAIMSKDITGRALAGGATVTLLVQALLNIYSVIGLGPVTGKPLPFVTQGGSAMLGAFILLGLILSVSRFGNQSPPKIANISNYQARVDDYQLDEERDIFRTSSRGSSKNVGQRREAPSNKPARSLKQSEKTQFLSRSIRSKNISARKEEADDEISLDWRGDSGSHLPRNRSRK